MLRGQGNFSSHGNAMYSTTSHESVQVTVIQKVARCGKNPCTSSGVAIAPIQNSVRDRIAHSVISIGIEIDHRERVHRVEPRKPRHPEVHCVHRFRPARVVVRKNEP